MQLSEVLRNFPLDQVPQRLTAALIKQGVAPENIEIVDLDTAAVDRGLNLARQGDLLALLTGTVEWTEERVLEFRQSGGRS